jgi:hypothetical protein
MGSLIDLIDHTRDFTAGNWVFLICVLALIVVWKALDVVGKSQRDKSSRRRP